MISECFIVAMPRRDNELPKPEKAQEDKIFFTKEDADNYINTHSDYEEPLVVFLCHIEVIKRV